MVFFTCNHCGESVKKPAVEKHYNTKCRGATKNVSCMDCLKDFHAEEYVAHTKCITEAQKYSGKDYVHKEPKNSGAKKQESWMDIIRAILDSDDYKLSEHARSAFQRLQSVDNVPRKKAKFQNFVKNCMKMPMRLAEEVWSVLEKEQEKMKSTKQQENVTPVEDRPYQNGVKRDTSIENGHVETAKKNSKKDKKTKNNEGEVVDDAASECAEQAKKKSKKNKANEAEVATLGDINGNEQPPKKKSKKAKTETEELIIGALETNEDGGDAPKEIGQEETAKKKSKKNKKANKTEVVNNLANEYAKPAKKKNKANASEALTVADINTKDAPPKKKLKKAESKTEEVIPADDLNTDTTLGANGDGGDAFEWSAVIDKIARKNAEGITVEKLKKHVLKKYVSKLGVEELTEKQQKKFEKKFGKNLKKSSCLQLEGETVKAC
ncbi:cell growth-regulating nucleolar protein [Rhagoletis pomonella]|uniref:cell growth-regulating nucleolar protein n=1 Tax=Rhagoletis pomonella TaxID=28610 RepID=UPI001780E618|nr:cell growth-regulating nucleolar protein [Rhagoletis pomonella]